ncbi:dihydrolipoamide acetyltransferase family protein [Streptomyces sp. E11-3]|uniref:dihydrolipoamide acetyltransferase family protein n=1 Tax=Streptomyces sp. E11-3 TaxID=3110112 RepID=UPI00397FD09B
MGEFRMPSLGADMTEGTLTEWLVAPGDSVTKGEPIAVIETTKSAIEVESFESGTVTRLLAEPGDVLPVGTPLATIEAVGDAASPKASAVVAPPEAPAGSSAAAQAPRAPQEPVGGDRPASGPAPKVPPQPTAPAAHRDRAPAPPLTPAPSAAAPPPVTPAPAPAAAQAEAGPLVRHLAAERGVDLATVHGTGRGGRITRADVEQWAGAPHPPPRVRATPYARRLAGEQHIDLASLRGTGHRGAIRAADVHAAVRARTSGASATAAPAHAAAPTSREAQRSAAMRQAIAELMTRAKREIPHYYLSTTVDLSTAMDWMRRHNRDHPPGERLVPAALLLKAAAVAARRVPELNGFWQNGGFEPGAGVHLGVAVSLRDGGLLAPVIHEADTLKPPELMAQLKDLVGRARKGRLRGADVSGATLTVTSLGDQGVESVLGVIYPPQVALVGFGTVVERPWAQGGMVGVRPVVTATLSADHRATDGATGARYLAAVDRLLQKPEEL